MGLALLLITVIMLGPVVLYVRHVAIVVPRRGREMQEKQWRPLATKLGGKLVRVNGVSKFSVMTVPFGPVSVEALVHDRAVIDGQISTPLLEYGGWKTFVQAKVLGPNPAWSAVPHPPGAPAHGLPGHAIVPELGTPEALIAQKLTPDVRTAFAMLGGSYRYLIAGPSLVTIEIPGVCDKPELLEAAIWIAGQAAHPMPPAGLPGQSP
jgi:hypothetical protein